MTKRALGFLVGILLVEVAILYPGVVFRGEVLTSSALAYGIPPWKGNMPTTERPLRGNPTLSDDLFLFTPWDSEIRSALADGEAPLWNHLNGCGMPLLANNQSAVLAPTHALRWVWNSPRARTLGLLAKPFIAAVGMFLLLNRWGVGAFGSVVGAVAWSNSAAMTVWLLYPLSEVAAWFAWVLLGISEILGIGGEPRRRGGVVLTLSVAAMLLSGHLPTAAQLLSAAAAGTAVVGFLHKGARRRLHWLVFPTFIGFLLASPQLLPTARYIAHSRALERRGGSVPSATASLPPRALWSWVVPRGFGSPERYGYEGPSNFNESSATIGLAGLLLALIAVVLVADRFARALALLVAMSCALAYGVTPFPWIVGHMPLLRLCGGQRWTILAQWGMAALAAVGMSRLHTMHPRRLRLAAGISISISLPSPYPLGTRSDYHCRASPEFPGCGRGGPLCPQNCYAPVPYSLLYTQAPTC